MGCFAHFTVDSCQQDDPFLGHTLCLGSMGLCHKGCCPRLSHLLLKLCHLDRILGQALYTEPGKGKASGT
jgi:hypothetical protein